MGTVPVSPLLKWSENVLESHGPLQRRMERGVGSRVTVWCRAGSLTRLFQPVLGMERREKENMNNRHVGRCSAVFPPLKCTFWDGNSENADQKKSTSEKTY